MSPDKRNEKHVYLHITVRRKNRGFAYRATAHPEGEEQITLEGWSAGSEKEVRKSVQGKIERIMAERKRAGVKAAAKDANLDDSPSAAVENPTEDTRITSTISGMKVSYSIKKSPPQAEEKGDP